MVLSFKRCERISFIILFSQILEALGVIVEGLG